MEAMCNSVVEEWKKHVANMFSKKENCLMLNTIVNASKYDSSAFEIYMRILLPNGTQLFNKTYLIEEKADLSGLNKELFDITSDYEIKIDLQQPFRMNDLDEIEIDEIDDICSVL